MNGIALKNFRQIWKVSINELAKAILIEPKWIRYMENGFEVEPYYAKKIDQFFFVTMKPLVLIETMKRNTNEIYFDQPCSSNYYFSYPKEMMLHPLSETTCAKLIDAESDQPKGNDIAPHASFAATKPLILKNTLFLYTETMPSVGDMSTQFLSSTFSHSYKKLITWLAAV